MDSASPVKRLFAENWAAGRALRARAQSVMGLIIILAIALSTSPHASDGSLVFLDAGNLTDILRQVSVIGILSLGMTFVILTAGIDLSVGSLLALSSSIVALALTRSLFPWPLAWAVAGAAVLAIAATTLAGFVNGQVLQVDGGR